MRGMADKGKPSRNGVKVEVEENRHCQTRFRGKAEAGHARLRFGLGGAQLRTGVSLVASVSNVRKMRRIVPRSV